MGLFFYDLSFFRMVISLLQYKYTAILMMVGILIRIENNFKFLSRQQFNLQIDPVASLRCHLTCLLQFLSRHNNNIGAAVWQYCVFLKCSCVV